MNTIYNNAIKECVRAQNQGQLRPAESVKVRRMLVIRHKDKFHPKEFQSRLQV